MGYEIHSFVAEKLARLLHNSATEMEYPKFWSGWRPPISFYVFESADGDIAADIMDSEGAAWWRGINGSIHRIEGPSESECASGVLLFPLIKFLLQGKDLLVSENYGNLELLVRRRSDLRSLEKATLYVGSRYSIFLRQVSRESGRKRIRRLSRTL